MSSGRRRARKSSRVYQKSSEARRAVIEAAYKLFARRGINAVSIEAIAAKSGTGKVTLYRHFGSKEDLLVAVLDLHEQRWSVGWLQAEVLRRREDPRERLLMVFTLFDEWMTAPDFFGCPFIRTLLEAPPASAPYERASAAMDRLQAFLTDLAISAQLDRPRQVAAIWQILMKGCVVSAHAGQTDASQQALEGAARMLSSWPRRLS